MRLQDAGALLRKVLGLNDALDAIERMPTRVGNYIMATGMPRPPQLPATVFVLAMGVRLSDEGGGATFVGTSVSLAPGEHKVATLETHRALCDVSVIVFCDLARVDVRGIYRGVDFMHAGMQHEHSCPIVHLPSWLPGILVRVQLEARNP
jgi:hypothetical protein